MAEDYEREEIDDLDWVRPPQNVQDAAGWDKYWQQEVADGVIGFHDWFIHDGPLARILVKLGLRTVLCAGNGVSLEPHALSYAGFQVTAADLSAWATEFNRKRRPKPTALKSLLYSSVFFRPIFYHSIRETFRRLGWLAERAVKRLQPIRRRGGQVEFLTGDLLDPAFCRGPFDVIIERRTAQLHSRKEPNEMLQSLSARLNPRGIFVSHVHMGWWKPGTPRDHILEPWFRQHGFTISYRVDQIDRGLQNKSPIALLSLSTG
jgi:SAM-dependent methyltransferase